MDRRESKAVDQNAREGRGGRDREGGKPETGTAAAPRWRAVLKENLEIAVLAATGLVALLTVLGAIVGSARWLKAGFDAEIAELEGEIVQVKHDLEDKIAGVATYMEWRINTTSDGLQQQIVSLREQMNGMQQQINGLQQQINGLQQQINVLQEQVALIVLRLPARDPGGEPDRGYGLAGSPHFSRATSGAPE